MVVKHINRIIHLYKYLLKIKFPRNKFIRVLITALRVGPSFLTHLVHHLLDVKLSEGPDVEVRGGAWEQALSQSTAAAPPGASCTYSI